MKSLHIYISYAIRPRIVSEHIVSEVSIVSEAQIKGWALRKLDRRLLVKTLWTVDTVRIRFSGKENGL